MSEADTVRSILGRLGEFGKEAEAILSTHEAASARVVTLEKSYADLGELSLDQDELFREALRAIEVGLYRASHVMAWAAFIDFLHRHLIPDHLTALQGVREKWMLAAPEDLRDRGEFAVIEAGKAAGIYTNTKMKALHGLLNKRNECAHPSEYFPDLNEALGYVAELFKRVKELRP